MTPGSVELQRLCLPTSTTRKVRLLSVFIGCPGTPTCVLCCHLMREIFFLVYWKKNNARM